MLEGGAGSATCNCQRLLLDGEPIENHGEEWEEWEFDENAALGKETSESQSEPVQQPKAAVRIPYKLIMVLELYPSIFQ